MQPARRPWRLTFPRAVAALLTLSLASAACAQEGADRAAAGSTCEAPFAEAGALRFSPEGWQTDFCTHSVPYAEIKSGGPPRDGIPPLDDPRFVSVSEAEAWLSSREPVILLRHGGAARAYPLQVLIWHEIVNDRVAGTPVAVTFCPLCNAALVFKRPTVEGEVLTFGTTGNLRKSDLVMWDRQTESWWQQFTGEAIVGRLTGQQLEVLPAPIVAWETFRARYPEAGRVLSRETGYDRRYGQNPYAGYDDVDQSPFMYDGPVDGKRPPMARVVGVAVEENARAYPLDVLRQARAVNDRLGGAPVVVWWKKGAASALDAPDIAQSRDVGQTGAFRRTLSDGRTLTFRAADGGAFVDEETGSTWNVLGEATDGPLRGRALEPVPHHDIFWFVWSAFQPGGEVYNGEAGAGPE